MKQEIDSLQQKISREQSPKHNNRIKIQAEVNKQSENLNSDLTSINHKSVQQITENASLSKVSYLNICEMITIIFVPFSFYAKYL